MAETAVTTCTACQERVDIAERCSNCGAEISATLRQVADWLSTSETGQEAVAEMRAMHEAPDG